MSDNRSGFQGHVPGALWFICRVKNGTRRGRATPYPCGEQDEVSLRKESLLISRAQMNPYLYFLGILDLDTEIKFSGS